MDWLKKLYDSVFGPSKPEEKITAVTTVHRADGKQEKYETSQPCPATEAQMLQADINTIDKVTKTITAQNAKVGDVVYFLPDNENGKQVYMHLPEINDVAPSLLEKVIASPDGKADKYNAKIDEKGMESVLKITHPDAHAPNSTKALFDGLFAMVGGQDGEFVEKATNQTMDGLKLQAALELTRKHSHDAALIVSEIHPIADVCGQSADTTKTKKVR